MPFSKMTKQKYPPRLWALVGYPGAGKSTFSTKMRGPFVVIDADHRYDEVLPLIKHDVFPVSDSAVEHTEPHQISKRLRENMPGVTVGTIIVDSLTAIIAPFVVNAMVEKEEGEGKNLMNGFKDKALAMRELQDAVTRYGTDVLWIYHLNDARDSKGRESTKATVSALELVRLTRSINMQIEVVSDGNKRGVKIAWARRGRANVTLWDESGEWKDMPERIEHAAYDGLSEADMDRLEMATPEVFASHQVAVEWAIQQGAFENKNINHAQNAYRKLLREAAPKDLAAMTPLWIADVKHRLAVKENGGDE